MAEVFDHLLKTGFRKRQLAARTEKARKWYRNAAKNRRDVTQDDMFSDKTRAKGRVEIGSMYMFKYKAKYAKQLPYYDRFPLIFPINIVSDGFYGINMHYLPLQLRAKLMDELYTIANNDRYDSTTKLRISYDVLNRASRFRYFKPCIKKYLNSQLQSRLIYVYPAEWDIALFLPLADFTASESVVHRDSRRIIEKG